MREQWEKRNWNRITKPNRNNIDIYSRSWEQFNLFQYTCEWDQIYNSFRHKLNIRLKILYHCTTILISRLKTTFSQFSITIHIKPEWYFLFAHSILRAIPNKLGGVIGLVIKFITEFLLIILFYNNLTLRKQLIEYPFTNINILFTTTYFLYFILNFYLRKLWDILNIKIIIKLKIENFK